MPQNSSLPPYGFHSPRYLCPTFRLTPHQKSVGCGEICRMSAKPDEVQSDADRQRFVQNHGGIGQRIAKKCEGVSKSTKNLPFPHKKLPRPFLAKVNEAMLYFFFFCHFIYSGKTASTLVFQIVSRETIAIFIPYISTTLVQCGNGIVYPSCNLFHT